MQLCGSGRLVRQEAAAIGRGQGVVPGDDSGVGVEPVEQVGQQPHLVLAHLAQHLGCEPLLFEEIEYARGAIVAGWIIGGSGEPRSARAVGDGTAWGTGRERLELAEPTRDMRLDGAARGNPQKAVTLAQLAVLVAAA